MEYTQFGQALLAALRAKRVSQARLGARISHPWDGATFDSTGIRNLMTGKRRATPELVKDIIAALELTPDEAGPLWAAYTATVLDAAGPWPENVPVIDRIRELIDARERSVIAGDSEFAARQAARRTRRRRRGTPPAATAITAAATLAATWLTHRTGGTHTDLALAAATLSGERAAPQVTAIPWWAPADAEERRAA